MKHRFDGDKVFFTSDTHFYHTNIIDFCKRPFKEIEEMNETLIANWNKTVGPNDIIFHLGDFCLGDSEKWNRILDRLNGNIYLILGNHDLRNFRKSYEERFKSVTMQMNIEIENQKICLNHYPFLCYDGSYNGDWQLFGHVHTNKNNTSNDARRLEILFPTQYDVGVDNNNFTPISFAVLKKVMEEQIQQSIKEKI